MALANRDKIERQEKKANRILASVSNMPHGESFRTNAGKSLFKEFNDGDTDIKPIYSLTEFHDKFIECGDLTEYKAAIALCGNFTAWQDIKKRWPGFNTILDVWKNEIRVKLTSEAMDKITSLISEGTDTTALSAAKWIADQTFNKKTESPKSAQAKAIMRKEVRDELGIPEQDMSRIESMLNLVDATGSKQ